MWQLFIVPVASEFLLGKTWGASSNRVASTVNAWNDVEPLYHSYGNIRDEVHNMKSECEAAGVEMSTKTVEKDGVSMDIIHLRTQPSVTENRFRVGVVFGEHPRELISPETGLRTLNSLCATSKSKEPCMACKENHKSEHASLLEEAESARAKPMDWQIVLNANPNTRARLERTGDFCARTNPHNVDLNRNWDDKFDAVGDHGPAAFSEAETSLYRDQLEEFKPHAYLSIHSGQLSMYGPHAYSTGEEDDSYAEFGVLHKIQPLCKDCTVGPAGMLQGHPITGSSFDYVRDKLKSDYSYAFEIYLNANADVSSGPNGCFRYFNPPNADSYERTTAAFSNVVLQTGTLSYDHSMGAAGNTKAASEEAGASAANMRTALIEEREDPRFMYQHDQ